MEYNGKKIYWIVGPSSSGSDDFLRSFDAATDKLIAELPIGPRGSNGICSVSLHLIGTDNVPAEFQFWDSSGTGKIDGQKIFDNLLKVAEIVAGFFKK